MAVGVYGAIKQEVITKFIAILYSFVASIIVISRFSTQDFVWQHVFNWHLLNLILLFVVPSVFVFCCVSPVVAVFDCDSLCVSVTD